MAERQIKRNSRGQIVSYEIAAINDPTVATPEYGKFLLQGVNEEGTLIEKYSDGSFNEEINTDITLELVTSDTIIDTQIVLNEIITTQDQRYLEVSSNTNTNISSSNTNTNISSTTASLFPFGVPGNSINEFRTRAVPGRRLPEVWRWIQTSAGRLWQQIF